VGFGRARHAELVPEDAYALAVQRRAEVVQANAAVLRGRGPRPRHRGRRGLLREVFVGPWCLLVPRVGRVDQAGVAGGLLHRGVVIGLLGPVFRAPLGRPLLLQARVRGRPSDRAGVRARGPSRRRFARRRGLLDGGGLALGVLRPALDLLLFVLL